jgi:hypothetical protein
MSTTTTRRRDPRYPLMHDATALIEVDDVDRPGERQAFQILDVSVSGISFGIPHAVNGIEPDRTITGAMLRVGSCAIRGHLILRYISGEGGWQGLVCGGLFYPDEYEDQERLMSLLAGLGSAQRG